MAVLLRVKHFKKRRRRIALEITAGLVNFIEQQHRVRRSRTLDSINNTSGHSSYIRTAMPTNLCLVVQTTERHTLILTSERLRYRLTKRGLAYAGRTDKAYNRRTTFRRVHHHRKLLEYAFLYFFKAIVILVKNPFGCLKIGVQFRILSPWKIRQQLQIGILDGIVGALRIKSAQFFKLLVEGTLYRLREVNFLCFFFKSPAIVIIAV